MKTTQNKNAGNANSLKSIYDNMLKSINVDNDKIQIVVKTDMQSENADKILKKVADLNTWLTPEIKDKVVLNLDNTKC